MKYVVKKGRHWSWPMTTLRAEKNFSRVSYRVQFTESCLYALPGEDQKDWNKLLSVRFCFFDPRKETMFAVWRANPETRKIELSHYYHVAGKRIMNEPVLSVDVGRDVWIDMRKDAEPKRYAVHFSTADLDTMSMSRVGSEAYTHNLSRAWLGWHWFGGNRKAPQDIIIEIQKL